MSSTEERARAGQPPAHPQHCHDGDATSHTVPDQPQQHWTDPRPSGLLAEEHFRRLQHPSWPGGPHKGDAGSRDGQERCCSLGHACLQHGPASSPAKLCRGGRLRNGEIHPRPGLLGSQQHDQRWAGPSCHCRDANSLAETSMPPAEGSPSPPGRGCRV